MFRKLIIFSLAATLTLVTIGCAKRTYLENMWENPNRTTDTLDRIAVLALLDSPDRNVGFEDDVVAALQTHDIPAIAGHTIMPEQKAYDRAAMEAMLNEAEAEGVLIFKLIAVENTFEYREPPVFTAPEPYHPVWVQDPHFHYYYPAPDYYAYWYPAFQVTTNPGYWENTTAYRLEASLFNNDNDRLIWTATTVTEDPVSFNVMTNHISETIAEKLAQKTYAGIS